MGIFSFLFNRKKTSKSHKQDWLDVKEELEKREEEVVMPPSVMEEEAWQEFLEEVKTDKSEEVLAPINLDVLEEDKPEEMQKKKNVEKTNKPAKTSTRTSKTKVGKFDKNKYTFGEKGIGEFNKGTMVLWNRKVSEIESTKGKKAQICTLINGKKTCKLVLLSSLCLATIK